MQLNFNGGAGGNGYSSGGSGGDGGSGATVTIKLLPAASGHVDVCYNGARSTISMQSTGKININAKGGAGGYGASGSSGYRGADGRPGANATSSSYGGMGGNGRYRYSLILIF